MAENVEIEVITWRTHEVGGRATFEYADGSVSTHWLSREDSETVAEQVFEGEHNRTDFDGGCRWTSKGQQAEADQPSPSMI